MRWFAPWLLLAVLGRAQADGSSSKVADSGARQPSDRVTLADIEAGFRSVRSAATGTVTKSKSTAAAAAAAGGALVVAAAFLYGRRRGRRRASVLEIRRV
jgi:hypothetical protein